MSQPSALEELDWPTKARKAIERAAKSGEPFDAYTLSRNGAPDPPPGHSWGGVFRAAKARGIIETAGYGPSDRPSRKGGACYAWRGTPQPGRFFVPATPSTGRTDTPQETT